jgi:hypothetical protein
MCHWTLLLEKHSHPYIHLQNNQEKCNKTSSSLKKTPKINTYKMF